MAAIAQQTASKAPLQPPQKNADQESWPDAQQSAPSFDVPPGEGVDEVMGLLFSDAVGTAIPQIGDEESWREIGDMERNTPPARAGKEQMWVRGWYSDAKPDKKNLTRMLRKGWTPRAPDMKDHAGYLVIGFGGQSVISVNGMILMERDIAVGDQFRAVNRQRIAMQSAGANLDESGTFDSRYGQMFGSVKTMAKTGRDAADLIDN